MTLRALILLLLLSTSAMAEIHWSNGSRSPNAAAAELSIAASAALPVVPLSEEKRPIALALGIALVLITFHRALLRRQRA
jgi:hypothetical protein